MGKRLITTGTTDSNGQVKITYTGKGAGKLQLTAESGTLQSETYVLTDALFISNGDLNCSSNGQVTIETDGYTLSPIDTSTYAFVYYSTSSAGSTKWIRFDKGYSIEFEVLSYTGTNIFRLDGNTSETIFTIGSTGKYRIEYLGTSTKVYLNDTLLTTVTTVEETKNPRFRINANSTLKIKNWLHY